LIDLGWIGLVVTFTLLVVIARWSLWAGLTVSAITLGLFYLPLPGLAACVWQVLADPSIISLAFAVGLIPVIGGTLERSGLLGDLVDNLRIGKRLFLMSGPALLGMLPVPGGAILSAPLVNKAGGSLPGDSKVAINIWFRHVLTMIYPLAALLPAAKMASIDLYIAVLYITPVFIFVAVIGYVFLLREVKGRITYASPFDPAKLALPVVVLLSAPVIHITLLSFMKGCPGEFPLVLGVLVSLLLAFWAGKFRGKDIFYVCRRMKPWRYALIILAIFIFMNVFRASGAAGVIARIPLSKSVLIVAVGAILGVVTGRVQVPVSIMLPIYQAKFGAVAMPPLTFMVMYFAIFIGYIISPVHPCVLVTMEYFGVGFRDFFRKLAAPAAISLLAAFAAGLLFIK